MPENYYQQLSVGSTVNVAPELVAAAIEYELVTFEVENVSEEAESFWNIYTQGEEEDSGDDDEEYINVDNNN